ncbi:hypothetical protein MKW98_019865 [Papaver atlanticum]|uniref:Uncharacterized protein n=1 Tax=Papaver atlanticum TaxID=357466 RepID=A0AAD4X5U9_9MAGN|nr:hypothetical protein MKW98_019865 [Papaver atlanticum]
MASLFALPGDQFPGKAFARVFTATLDLLVAYKDQVAAKKEEGAGDDYMDGFQSDDEKEDEDGSDWEMELKLRIGSWR